MRARSSSRYMTATFAPTNRNGLRSITNRRPFVCTKPARPRGIERRQLAIAKKTAAPAIKVDAAVFFAIASWRLSMPRGRAGFVQTDSLRFVIDRKPFRFVGANVAVMYRDDDRARMPETLRQVAQIGIKVVRVWASGEGGPNDVKPVADFHDWPRTF